MLSFPGTITISEKTCQYLVEDIVNSLIYQGFNNILLLNGHGGNDVVLTRLTSKYSNTVNINSCNWYDLNFLIRLKKKDKTYLGDHADRLETEIMLAINKKMVKMNLAIDDMPNWSSDYENLTDYSKIMKFAVEGYPTKASEKRGILLLEKIISNLCMHVTKLQNYKKGQSMASLNTENEHFERKNFITPEKEPYICGHCGAQVIGGRYNNHCPQCLWSKHVDDKIPGDRASKCQQLMQPVGVKRGKKDIWRILQKCTGCDHEFIVDSSPEDNFDIIIELSQNPI